jgi:hypothetical protein
MTRFLTVILERGNTAEDDLLYSASNLSGWSENLSSDEKGLWNWTVLLSSIVLSDTATVWRPFRSKSECSTDPRHEEQIP